MCPHKPDDDCFCRKPKPGLLLQAAKELSLDLPRSWMIGDAWSDILAGQNAGVRQAILLKTGRGRDQLLQSPPDNVISHIILDNLPVALDTIFTIENVQAAGKNSNR
jgi:D-glycero-D-manno-heptose 1,7-bisphosphate phosphatase